MQAPKQSAQQRRQGQRQGHELHRLGPDRCYKFCLLVGRTNPSVCPEQRPYDMIENPVHEDNDVVTDGLKDTRPDDFAKIEKRKNALTSTRY